MRGGLAEDGQYVALTHDKIFRAIEFYLGAAVFTIEHGVAGFEHHGFVLRAVAYGDDFTLEGLLFCRVGDDDATDGFFFCGSGLDEHAVC